MGTLLVRSLLTLALLLTFICPVWAQDTKGVGVVTALTGQAGLKRPQAPETPLKLRDNLFVRDVVDTQKESLARILLMGKSTVTVRELSRFEIREEVRPDGSQRALINLAEGKIRVMVARRLMRPGDEVEIRTPNAVAAVRGSDGIIEVSTLPDGRPLTVITGVSGEFQLTLPTTPPFITRGRGFEEGPAFAGAGGPLLAMAETASDAGRGLLLAQPPIPGISVTPPISVTSNLEVQVAGPVLAQTVAQALRSDAHMRNLIGGYQTPLSASGFRRPSPQTIDKLAANAEAAAHFAASAAGLGGAVNGGGGGGPLVQAPILPGGGGGPRQPPVVVDTRISVLVYDCSSCADTINGLTGSGRLFRAVNASDTEFKAMTATQIGAFRVLAIPSTDELDHGVDGLLQNNAATRVGNAITGNQVVSGIHTAHRESLPLDQQQALDQLVINVLQFAALGGSGKTGLAAATDGCNSDGCVGGKAGAPWINEGGSFLNLAGTTVKRNKNINSVQAAAGQENHPINTGSGLRGGKPLDFTKLSGWTYSAHSTFKCPPADYQPIHTTATGKNVTLVKPKP